MHIRKFLIFIKNRCQTIKNFRLRRDKEVGGQCK